MGRQLYLIPPQEKGNWMLYEVESATPAAEPSASTDDTNDGNHGMTLNTDKRKSPIELTEDSKYLTALFDAYSGENELRRTECTYGPGNEMIITERATLRRLAQRPIH